MLIVVIKYLFVRVIVTVIKYFFEEVVVTVIEYFFSQVTVLVFRYNFLAHCNSLHCRGQKMLLLLQRVELLNTNEVEILLQSSKITVP